MAKPITRKKSSASTALAGALAAFDETASPGAAHSMITQSPVVVEEITAPLAVDNKSPIITEQKTSPTDNKPLSNQQLNFELEHYRQYLLWQQNITHVQYQSTNLTLFVKLIEAGLIPTPSQTLYFAAKELRVTYMQQALLEAANQDVKHVMQALADILHRG